MKVAALSIAGSDSGGGAGIQADLRVMSKLGVFGTTAITVTTAQNLQGVHGLEAHSPSFVRKQIQAVLSDFPIRAIKTGMLWSKEIISALANELSKTNVPLVVDPVMVATSGDVLLERDAIDSYKEALFPHATLITPNLDEAKVLLKRRENFSRDDLIGAANTLHKEFSCNVLLKGGHLSGNPIDVLITKEEGFLFTHQRIANTNTHGSGCMLSSAIASRLALGDSLRDATHKGLSFVHDALLLGARKQAPLHLADLENASIKNNYIKKETIR